MKSYLTLAAAAAFGLFAVGAANAADMPSAEAPMPAASYAPPTQSWTGLYVGAVGAYAWGHASGSFSAPSFITTWAANQFDLNGGLLGGTLGYNWDLHNNWVLGVEGDIAAGRIAGTSYLAATGGGPGPGFVPNNTAGEFHQDYFGTLRARAGWSTTSFGNPTLWYLTGGLAFSNGTRQISNTTVGNSVATATHLGWTVGGGVESKITDQWSVKAEVLYADLGTENYQSSTSTVVTDVPLTNTLVRLGVNYKF